MSKSRGVADFYIGDRVEGGRGEDHDTGEITDLGPCWHWGVGNVPAGSAVVVWDSGVITRAPYDVLTLVEEAR